MGTLKSLVIAVTGTLEHDLTQIKKWIEANGGRYSPNVRRGITHLITSKNAWKQASDAVQAANELGVFVVSYDWLEDSLHKRRKLAETQYTWEYLAQKKKRTRELKKLGPRVSTKQFNDGCEEIKQTTASGTSKSRRPHVVARKPKKSTSVLTAHMYVPFVSAAENLARRRKERDAAKAKQKGEEEAAKRVEDNPTNRNTGAAPSMAQSFTSTADNSSFPTSASSHFLSTASFQPASAAPGAQAKKPALKDLYHYYLDTTGFEYKVVLARCNLRENEITRYRLSILESHTKPHVYCSFIEYFPPGAGITPGSGEACIQALLDFDKTFQDSAAPGMRTEASADDDDEEEDETNLPPTSLPLPQQGLRVHPEAERLRALLLSPISSPTPPPSDQPYKNLVAPMGSTFSTAWRTFRHAFRDLSLLSWEERFDTSKTLYKARASHFGIEPFVYMRPKHGLPLGLRTQQTGLFQNQTLAPMAEDGSIIVEKTGGKGEIRENDDAYVYNAFNLPALQALLGSGIVGQAVARDVKTVRAAAEEAEKRAEEAEEARLRGLGLARKTECNQKPNYSRPLFNGVNGRPTTDAWGKYRRGEAGVGGLYGSGLLGGGIVKQRRPFPSERKQSW